MTHRGEGRIFSRNGSSHLWCAYYLRGKEYRESTGTADLDKAAKFLKHRLKEVGADQIGKATFVGPQQERMKVCKLLDALEGDYKLRGKDSPQFRAHLKHVREYFGAWRAVEVTAEAVDKYISARQEAGSAAATVNRSTHKLLAKAFRLAIENGGTLSSIPRRFATSPKKVMPDRASLQTRISARSQRNSPSICGTSFGSDT